MADDMKTANTTQPQFVTYEKKGSVAWIMLARPQYNNAQNYRLLNQLDGCFKQAVEDDERPDRGPYRPDEQVHRVVPDD